MTNVRRGKTCKLCERNKTCKIMFYDRHMLCSLLYASDCFHGNITQITA